MDHYDLSQEGDSFIKEVLESKTKELNGKKGSGVFSAHGGVAAAGGADGAC